MKSIGNIFQRHTTYIPRSMRSIVSGEYNRGTISRNIRGSSHLIFVVREWKSFSNKLPPKVIKHHPFIVAVFSYNGLVLNCNRKLHLTRFLSKKGSGCLADAFNVCGNQKCFGRAKRRSLECALGSKDFTRRCQFDYATGVIFITFIRDSSVDKEHSYRLAESHVTRGPISPVKRHGIDRKSDVFKLLKRFALFVAVQVKAQIKQASLNVASRRGPTS